MPFHAVYNSRRATPSKDTAAAVWGELARHYVHPELNAKSSKEDVWKGILYLHKMGYLVIDSETSTHGPVVTPENLPEIMAVVATPKPAKKERKPAAAPAPTPTAKKAKPKT